MTHELCTTFDVNQAGGEAQGGLNTWPRVGKLVSYVDTVLDWTTERLDRKFVSAMERCIEENPDRKREMKLLKRTVLFVVCLGLAITAVSIKLSVEAQMVYAVLG